MPLSYTPIVSALQNSTPFIGPEALERRSGTPIHLRLGANESPFGASALAISAMQKQVIQSEFYGDPEGWLLREALANDLGIDVSNICLGAGIDELLANACRLFVSPGDRIITTLGSYPTFEFGAMACGADIHRVAYYDNKPDLDGLLDAIKRLKAKIVYLANPDNPSGAWLSARSVSHWVEQLPEDCVLLLDEAYLDFADDPIVVNWIHPNVLRFRTFSKAHGMAGMRIGYVLSDSEHIRSYDKVRMHFGVNAVAQAGALASLHDRDHVKSVVRETVIGREEMSNFFAEAGFQSLPSSTNFLTVQLESRNCAESILNLLLSQGVFIRKPAQSPLDDCIRVTIGRPEQRASFYDHFEVALTKYRASR